MCRLLVALVVALFALCGATFSSAAIKDKPSDDIAPAAEGPRIGIVLIHGKHGEPNRGIASLASALDGAGYLVARPEMCWSRTRIYDRSFPDCLLEIDPAIAKLKERGAVRIVVAGESMGGLAALAYGAAHADLFGVIGLAPAHDPHSLAGYPDIAKSLAKAHELVSKGKGGEKTSFMDANMGPSGGFMFEIDTTPTIYLSFFGEDAPYMPALTPKLTAPLLWVAGTEDPTQKGGPGFAFDKAPVNPLNKYVMVNAHHLDTPDASRAAVLSWLKELAAK